MKMILMLVSAAALATSAGAETPVVADGQARLVVRVSYDDLNLNSVRGRERLNHRVTAAVRAMCRDDNLDPLAVEQAEQRCYDASLREAGTKLEQALQARSIGLAGAPQAIETIRR